ncbi:MAG TPA: hypothetical protein EYO32_09510 [Rhodospirillales bacterium]|nr:hypothetical protein [Rhodospirillales bacterium]HIN76884.1 hypothetical protein [Rhodospirillales bacterium]HIO39557.1 hypothetical protein [Rhodospirillales bacterium]
MEFTEKIEEIRTRADEANSNTNEYWSVSMCQEDRRTLLRFIDKLLEATVDTLPPFGTTPGYRPLSDLHRAKV